MIFQIDVVAVVPPAVFNIQPDRFCTTLRCKIFEVQPAIGRKSKRCGVMGTKCEVVKPPGPQSAGQFNKMAPGLAAFHLQHSAKYSYLSDLCCLKIV